MKASIKALIVVGIFVFGYLTFVAGAGTTLRGNILSYDDLGTLNKINNITLQNDSLFIRGINNNIIALFNAESSALLLAAAQVPNFTGVTSGFIGDVDNFDNIDGFSRFKETNVNNGSSASAGFVGVNDINHTFSIGIGSSTFSFLNITLPNIGALRLNSPSDMFFVNDFIQGWNWVSDLNNTPGITDPVLVMNLDARGNLNTAGNFTVNNTIAFTHVEDASNLTGFVKMFCKSNNKCFIIRDDGTERRLLDGGGSSIIIDEVWNFQVTPIFEEGINISGGNLDVNENVNLVSIDFNLTPTATSCQEGRIFWSDGDKTLNVCPDVNDVTLQVGQETHLRVSNKAGKTLPNGAVVYIDGAQGQRPTVDCSISNDSVRARAVGVMTHECTDNSNCLVTTYGSVRDLDTSSFSAGDSLYISPTQECNITNVIPTAPNFPVSVGTVLNSNPSSGQILVQIGAVDVIDAMVTGGLTAINNITASFFLGDGSLLTGVGGGNLSFNQSLTDDLYLEKETDINLPNNNIITARITADNLRLDSSILSSTNTDGVILIVPDGNGAVVLVTNRVLAQGFSANATGDNSELVEFRDGRTTIGSLVNYILSINRQNNPASVLYFGNDADNEAVIATNNNDLRIGNDILGAFTENMRIKSDGRVGIGTAFPDATLEVNGDSAGTVGGFVSGTFHIRSPGTTQFSSAAISGHNTFAGNTQLWYLGSRSTEDDNVQLINRQNADLILGTNDDEFLTITGSGNIGIGTSNPDASSILELFSTTRGFLLPRMTSTQIDEITPAVGLMIYDTDLNKLKLATPTAFKNLLTEDTGNTLAQETFSSTNVRFFGELGLPASQGWTDIATGIASIDLQDQDVFGVLKQVVRHNDNTGGGSTTSQITLTTQNWLDIQAFGASYSGLSRLDTVSGSSGFFGGLQADAAENPQASGNRRYGIIFDDSGGNIRLLDIGAGTVILDGTGGNPLILFDEWFSWEVVIPAGLGAAQFYVNGQLTTFTPQFRANTGGLGTKIIVSSGSTGGSNRIVYHDNFGVTIFEESSTKTLSASTMEADIAQVNIPEGRRNYTIILPDGSPRSVGAVLRVVANNLFGTVTLQNEVPATPEALFNGLSELEVNVFVKEIVGGINTFEQGNVYLGFKTDDVDRSKSIFAQLSSSVDQLPGVTTPVIITYNTQDDINGIGHSTTLNPGELEILPGFGGTYFVSPQPQVGKDSGGVKVDFDMFLQVDRNGTFVNELNSNIKLTIKDSDITDVIVSALTIELNEGDKIRMMQRISNAGVGMGLKNTDATAEVPRTPSIIFTMYRIGG